MHKHPCYEFVFAIGGTFVIQVGDNIYEDIRCCLLKANTPHRILDFTSSLRIVMKERSLIYFDDYFLMNKDDVSYVSRDEMITKNIFDSLSALDDNVNIYQGYDHRIIKCLKKLTYNDLDYSLLIGSLTNDVHLSASRLSHLFKEQVGVSIKKFLVWSKLKKAFNHILYSGCTMHEAAYYAGFYDQAHLSKAFKEFFGVVPSDMYNSRIIQV